MIAAVPGGALLPVVMAAWVWSAGARSARRRLRDLAPTEPCAPSDVGSGWRHSATARRRLAAMAAAVGAASFLPMPIGLVVGAVVAWAVAMWLGSLPSAASARRTARRVAELPLAVDLMAAAMLAGATPAGAIAAVSVAVGPPVADDLTLVAGSLAAGASLDEAWASAPADLQPVAAAFRRSLDSGTPASDILAATADELRAAQRAEWRQRAGRVGVRSALPLGLCFLPAFVLVGIVPVVVGLVRGLFG
jgi:Flp pilus assembly protein TadB